MDKIQILSPEISNKIAAGEVVENAASVVKELVENAIDAGASSIVTEIKKGGMSYIRVTDNGCGMSGDDARRAFLRHATSKIRGESDLERIQTLGFRGEALASIAAVSKVELLTKAAGQEGIMLELEAGGKVSEQPAGCPEGTTIVVKDLFYNTPARMKFLKSDKTETGYVTDIIERLILSRPDISVLYIVDGKERLFSSGDGQLRSCVYAVYGRDYAKGSLDVSRNENGVKVSGLVGRAEISRGNRNFQSFFLNGRYIKNKSLTYALESAYNNMLMTGKFPFFAVHLEIPPEMVDINVHPKKQEVKFSDERMVGNEIYWAVKNSLLQCAEEIKKTFVPKTSFEYKPTPALSEPVRQLELKSDNVSWLNQGKDADDINNKTDDIPESKAAYKIVGQLFDTYIVIQCGEKIILIDQHAAHERMIFERIKKLYKQKKTIGQVLLSPAAVVLSPKEYACLFDNIKIFHDFGFEIEEFGNNSILVRQAPFTMGNEELKSVITEFIEMMDSSGDFLSKHEEKMLEMIACKAAVKGGSMMHGAEMEALIEDILKSNPVSTCPHGRPIAITITRYELEKMFKRIV